MTLWKLEIARLVRTHRWMILFGVYVFFGVLGPITARYMAEIFERFGGDDFQVVIGEPVPAEGIAQFIGNAAQLGLLAVIVVGAAALAFDARPELAAFLRTRVRRPGALVIPRYVVTTTAAALALVAGTAVAWVLTEVLIGSLPAAGIIVGTVYGVLYLAFAVAVVAIVAGYARSLVMTVFGALAVLIVLPMIGMVDAIGSWLPSALFTAVAAMAAGQPAGEYVGAAVVTLLASAALLALAIRRAEAREL